MLDGRNEARAEPVDEPQAMVPGATVMRSGLLHRRQLLLAGGAGLASLALPLAAPEAQAVRSFYVATNGSDSAVGSQARPWRTISRAVRDLRPGDEVVVMPGTYNERVGIDRGGNADRADGYVTLRSATPGAARLRPPSGTYSGVLVYTSYVVIDGFDVVGGTGHAIEIGNGHHVKIRNCIAHDSGGGGIAAARSEFITIEGNTVYRNCATSRLHTSGISVYQCRNISGDRSTGGFRTIIRNNVSYANLQKWGNDHFDGNGIIVDDLRHTQVSGFPNYTYPTLVENNLCHSNGGKGIHVFVSDNVTVRNNTSWRNNLDPNNRGTWRSELSNVNSRNNKWINNIAVADRRVNSNNSALGSQSTGGYSNSGTVWHNNLTFNGTSGQASLHVTSGNAAPQASNGNRLGVDPRFVRAAASDFDFRVRSGSPAIDAGTASFGLPSRDLAGNARVVGKVDIGAYEFRPASGQSSPPPQPAPTPPPSSAPPVAEAPPAAAPSPPAAAPSPPATTNPTFAERQRQFESLFGRNPALGSPNGSLPGAQANSAPAFANPLRLNFGN